GECGQISNLAFGRPITNRHLDDSVRRGWGNREYSYQGSLQLQQELRPGFGMNVGYFWTYWGNQSVAGNTLVTPTDFTEFCVTAPNDPRLGSSAGQQICGFYDVNPNKFGQSDTLVTLAKNFGVGTPKELYKGVDLGFTARWGKGALLNGGVGIGRETFDYC